MKPTAPEQVIASVIALPCVREEPQHPPQSQHSLDRVWRLLRVWRLFSLVAGR